MLLNLTFCFNYNPVSFGIRIGRYGFLMIFFKNVPFINEGEF